MKQGTQSDNPGSAPSSLERAAEDLGFLLRATATDFVAVGTSEEPPTIHVYWKRKQRQGLLRKHDGFAGFPIAHHVSGKVQPLGGGKGSRR